MNRSTRNIFLSILTLLLPVAVVGFRPSVRAGTYVPSQQNDIVGLAPAVSRIQSAALGFKPAAPSGTPTITLSTANAASGITSAQTFLPWVSSAASNYFLFTGCSVIQAGSAFPDTNCVRGVGRSTTSDFGYVCAEFYADSTQVELIVKGQGGGYRVVVDGVEVLRVATAPNTGTAQAGGASTITLAAGASATNGLYNTQYVYITGGTGSGQNAQITGYVGATKVATVASAWATAPDATSTYELRYCPGPFSAPASTGSVYNVLFNYSGTRAIRRFRVECSAAFFAGCRVGPTDQIWRPATQLGLRCFWVGDSYAEGTGANVSSASYAATACAYLGWEYFHCSVGGTGYLNPDAGIPGRTTVINRLTPPTNAWQVNVSGTGGTYTVTQGSTTTGVIASGASLATIQSAFDTAFGAGNFLAFLWDFPSGGGTGFVVIGLGSNASLATAMTLNTSALTGGSATINPYAGDIAPNVPKDGSGNALPFVIVLSCGHNDTADSSASYTPRFCSRPFSRSYRHCRQSIRPPSFS